MAMATLTAETIQRPFRAVLRGLLIALVGTLLAIMTAQIVLRYGFNESLLWAEEMCRYMLIWISFLAVVLAFERGEIAAIGFLGAALPRVPALLLAILCAALSLALCLLLIRFGWLYADRAGRASIPALGFLLESLYGADAPKAPGRFWVYVALPFGMGLLALRLAGDIVLCASAIVTGRSVADIYARQDGEAVE
ncbi:MAG: TRAP transporter small permease subunit [Roseovarius sp.]